MTTDHDPRTRIVLSWLREDAHEDAERMLLRALDEVDATPQRRAWRPAWRFRSMNTYAKLLIAAAAVLVVAVVGYRFLPRDGGIGGSLSVGPSPSPALLARGTFHAMSFASVELDASGSGDSVTGTMDVSEDGGADFVVDLKCSRIGENDLLWIVGDVTTSTDTENASAGTRAGIVFKRGSPVQAIFVFQMNDPRSATCQAFVDDMMALGEEIDGGLQPIVGTVQLAP